MKEKLLSIGKMASLNHIAVSTLRLYDEKGLLTPQFVDPESGYRYYDINQNARLDMIIYMRELGLSLAEIKDILNKKDSARIEALLGYKVEKLSQDINALKAQRRAVNRAIESLERYRKSPRPGNFALEYIEKRRILAIDCTHNFYDDDIHSYEELLRDLRLRLSAEGISQIHSYNIGTSIKARDFMDGKMKADQIFLFSDLKENTNKVKSRLLDNGMWACVYIDNYDDELPYIPLLKKYCDDHHYHVSGDYICEVMTGFNIFDDDPKKMFLRLQVPVTFNNR